MPISSNDIDIERMVASPARVAALMAAPLLDIDHAAECLSVSRSQLENILRDRDAVKPRVVRIGRRVLFRPADLRAFADALASREADGEDAD